MRKRGHERGMSDTDDTPPAPPASLFSLAGQVALVTGASRGLGWAIARALAAAGAHVVLTGRDEATLAPRRNRLAGWGLRAESAAFDVADAAAIDRVVADIAARHGRLDILVSNAGFGIRKPLLEQTEQDWSSLLDVHLTAGWRLSRAAARVMAPAGYGRIVLVGSINGFVARPGITGYIAAKAGLHGLARALAVDLAPSGITVNALAPGYFPTEGNSGLRATDPGFQPRIAARTPLGRWGEPAELGAAALYLCSPAAGFTTGSVLTVDGGLTAAI
jgi:gluconate 5-dehydrogenase